MHRNNNAALPPGRLGVEAASLLRLNHGGTPWGPVVDRLRHLLPQLVDPPLGPTPTDRPLHVDIPCQLLRVGGAHRLTVNSDWSVSTVHDVAAEDVAIALGAPVPACLAVTRRVPLVRGWLQAVTRRQPPQLVFNCGTATWFETSGQRPTPVPDLRSPAHVGHWMRLRPTASLHVKNGEGSGVSWFDRLADAVTSEHQITLPIQRPALPVGSSHAVSIDAVLDWLWDVGLSPILVTRLHEAADVGERALPLEVILAVITDIRPPARCEVDGRV